MVCDVRSLCYHGLMHNIACTKESKETSISNFRQDLRLHREGRAFPVRQ